MGALSHDQFASQVNAGGSSRMLHTLEEPEVKPEVYAVGIPGHETKYDHPVVREQVVAHRDQLLADPTVSSDPKAMQGGWSHRSKVFLDSSVRVEGRVDAVMAGRAGKQIAIYDMHGERDVYMRKNTAQVEVKKPPPPKRVVGSRETGFTVEDRPSPRPARTASRPESALPSRLVRKKR